MPIDIKVGETTFVTFYAGWSRGDITWTNPAPLDLELYPPPLFGANNGAGQILRIKALQESGPHVINVAGKQSTSGQVTFNVKPE